MPINNATKRLFLLYLRCIPEECNDISVNRLERGALRNCKPTGWSSEVIVIIAGLVVACVCVSVLAASLARYNYQLKQRKRIIFAGVNTSLYLDS